MAVYFWDQTDVQINSTGILADAASIQTDNVLEPLYSLGRKGVANHFPVGPVRSIFRISYFPEQGNDPSIGILKTLKSLEDDVIWSGVNVEVSAVTGIRAYLTNYNIKATPNEVTRASVTYESFHGVSGEILPKRDTTSYNPSGLVGHGWTTYIVARSGYLDNPTYEFEYDANVRWEPIYILGKHTPHQVNLIGGDERLTFTKDVFITGAVFSGKHPHSGGQLVFYTGHDTTADIMAFKLLCETPAASGKDLSFEISGSRITSEQLVAQVDDFVRTIYTVTNFF